MDENTNSNNTPRLIIRSYNISPNMDELGTYCVEIETSAHTIIYPKARVAFGLNQAIAFPIGIQVMDKDGNIQFNYNLELKNQTDQDTNNTEE